MLLVGSGAYAAGSGLPDIPAVRSSVTDLGRCLMEHAGLAPAALTTLIDPSGREEFSAAVIKAAEQAEDTLIVYYVGHGLVDVENALHLATAATRDLPPDPATNQTSSALTGAWPLSKSRTARTSSAGRS